MNFSQQLQAYYNVPELTVAAASLAAANAVTGPAAINAITHVLVSAGIAYNHSSTEAEAFGNFRETRTTLEYYYDHYRGNNPQDYRWDAFKDFYNNEVGRKIAEYAVQNNLTYQQMNDLVIDAYANGQFILTSGDPRIPPNFSGFAGSYSTPAGMWNGPSAGWMNSSMGGGLTTPPSGPGLFDMLAPIFGLFHPNPLRLKDPLILDLDGDGIELVGLDASVAHFDFSGSGFAPLTGWMTGGDGALFHDANSDQLVVAAELFGAQSGSAFSDLALLDTNADGIINASDASFSQLMIWVDVDGDGVSDLGETQTLSAHNIVGISLNSTPSGTTVAGNLIVRQAEFIRGDNSTGSISEVNFAVDTLHTQFNPPPGFTMSPLALSLPKLNGYGNVADLSFAMSIDGDLEDDVLAFILQANELSGVEFDEAFAEIVLKWTGAETANPVIVGSTLNGQHLAVVEAFYGASFTDVNGTGATLNQLTDLPPMKWSSLMKCSPKLGQLALEFSGVRTHAGKGADEPFISEIGALLPIALCGRTSL